MVIKKLIPEYPATHIVHWPSGPVYACEKHAQGIINIGKILGFHIVASAANPGHECMNCINEQKINNAGIDDMETEEIEEKEEDVFDKMTDRYKGATFGADGFKL